MSPSLLYGINIMYVSLDNIYISSNLSTSIDIGCRFVGVRLKIDLIQNVRQENGDGVGRHIR